VINGEDSVTFGPDDPVDQKMMVYGTVLDVDDERSITVSNKNSIAARGVEEMTIDVDWIQSEASAKKLGSHVIEAMSHPVPTYNLEIFGHAGMRVGQIVALYDPRRGIGEESDPTNSNRYFVYSVNHQNSGGHSTNLGVREVIGSSGPRYARLQDVLANNNNAMNMNPGIEEYVVAGSTYLPAGYDLRSGVTGAFISPLSPTQNGGGAVALTGTGATPYLSTMVANPYPQGTGRFAHPYGEYFMLTATVIGLTKVGAGIVIEGWPTTGAMTKTLASRSTTLIPGQKKVLTLTGRFLSDADIPELEVGVRALNFSNTSEGAPAGARLMVTDFYFRTSPNQEDIYPMHGGAGLKSI
jgi:hypothetical protein